MLSLNGFGVDGLRLRTTGPSGIANVYYTYDPQGNLAQRLKLPNGGYGGTPEVPNFWSAYGVHYFANGTTIPAGEDQVGLGGKYGYYQDPTGLYLLGARYYDPSGARFLAEDPTGYQAGPNMYAFCDNNPITRSDPEGTQAEDTDGQAGNSGGGSAQASSEPTEADTTAEIMEPSAAVKDSEGYQNEQTERDALNQRLWRATHPEVWPELDEVVNPVPEVCARVVPAGAKATTLGRPGAPDVFVADAAELRGLNAAQIESKMEIRPSAEGYIVYEFPSSSVEGAASPLNRENEGFVNGGRTAGGAREYIIPNGPMPTCATQRLVK